MSDETPPVESPPVAGPVVDPTTASRCPSFAGTPVIAFVAGLGLLVAIFLIFGPIRAKNQAAADPKEIAELQAETAALLDQVNRERIALGLRPRETSYEPIDAVAERLKKDSETMVALAGSYQSMLAVKDEEITARNAEILEVEQKRRALAEENERLRDEVRLALSGGTAGVAVSADLERLVAERDALATQLEEARRQLQENAPAVTMADYQDLQRRLEETQRAKNFFEARAKQLEGSEEGAGDVEAEEVTEEPED